MRTVLTLFALFLVLAAPQAQVGAELYFGMTLLDPATEQSTPDSWFVVEEGKISKMGTGAPPEFIPARARHDFRGRYVIAGFIDTHAHMVLGPVRLFTDEGPPKLVTAYDPALVAYNGRMLLAHGVTTVRDTGGDTARTVAYKRDAAAGTVLGPEALVAGAIIDRSPVPFDGLLVIPSASQSITELVTQQARLGVDYVKFYTSLNAADLQEGIAAAQASGVRTIGHLEGVDWSTAAGAGITVLAHMMPINAALLPRAERDDYAKTTRRGAWSFFEWYERADLDGPEIRDMIASLVEHRVEVNATLLVFMLTFWGDEAAVRTADLAQAFPSMAENWKTTLRFDLGWKPDDYARAKAVWPKVLRLTRMLHEAGVVMTIGTDLENPFVIPGASYQRELRLHADAGVSNWAILRMATSDAAAALGIAERTGRLREGFSADAVFLESNPVSNISNAGSVVGVLSKGRLLNPSALKAGG
jgi:imidazolonepropionase-like amidohydrolase